MSTAIEQPDLDLQDGTDDRLYEVIDGIRVEKVMAIRQVLIANRLSQSINQAAMPGRSGFAVVEALFDFGKSDSPQLRPDMAYLSETSWPGDCDDPTTNAWSVVPDLAVEVVSPSNSADEIHKKSEFYLNAGVRQVWVFYLDPERVHVHDGSPTIRIVRPDEEIDFGAFLPGVRLPLRRIFGKAAPPV